jgi:hypothetical protein
MSKTLNAFKLNNNAYVFASTAPFDVENDTEPQAPPASIGATQAPLHQAFEQIGTDFKMGKLASIVIFVHGFNVKVPDFWTFVQNAWTYISEDRNSQTGDDRVLYIWYRWPAEGAQAPLKSTFSAGPAAFTWMVAAGVALDVLALLPWSSPFNRNVVRPIAGVTGAVLTLAPATLAAMRLSTYYRDTYRARSFGVLDLVSLIAGLGRAIRASDWNKNPINLSIIAHSLGAFVATETASIITDPFTEASTDAPTAQGDGNSFELAQDLAKTEKIYARGGIIGDGVFRLARLVLVSPDIPAEAMLQARANYLAHALHQFEEAYLFSNQGDEVVGQISTLANYICLPTTKHADGFRLANIRVLSKPGAFSGKPLSQISLGGLTLADVASKLAPNMGKTGNHTKFRYFDCTDYKENGTTYLSKALGKDNLSPPAHAELLFQYLTRGNKAIDVHSGYFKGPLTNKLIYRFASLGQTGAIEAWGGVNGLLEECKRCSIRTLFPDQNENDGADTPLAAKE